MKKYGYLPKLFWIEGKQPVNYFFANGQRAKKSGIRLPGTILTRTKQSFKELWIPPNKEVRKNEEYPKETDNRRLGEY